MPLAAVCELSHKALIFGIMLYWESSILLFLLRVCSIHWADRKCKRPFHAAPPALHALAGPVRRRGLQPGGTRGRTVSTGPAAGGADFKGDSIALRDVFKAVGECTLPKKMRGACRQKPL